MSCEFNDKHYIVHIETTTTVYKYIINGKHWRTNDNDNDNNAKRRANKPECCAHAHSMSSIISGTTGGGVGGLRINSIIESRMKNVAFISCENDFA